MIPTPNQSAIQTVLRTFLTGILPAGVPVVAGQVNRVPEPNAGDFVVMIPVLRGRLAFNIDEYVDCVFTASITGLVMTVTAVDPRFSGRIAAGLLVTAVGIAANTQVVSNGTGTGGVGTYNVSVSQTVGSETMACGSAALLQKTDVVMQCDVHGPNSSDNAQVIATAMRDEVAQRYFDPSTTGVAPLYADDPKQIPFINAEKQYETRWVVDCHLQANILVVFPQEFAAVVEVDVISVDATYPP